MVNNLQDSPTIANAAGMQLLCQVIGDGLGQSLTMRSQQAVRTQLIEIVLACARYPHGLQILGDAVEFLESGTMLTDVVRLLVDEWDAVDAVDPGDWLTFRDALGGLALSELGELFASATRWLRSQGLSDDSITLVVSPLEVNRSVVGALGLPVRPATQESIYDLFTRELPNDPAELLIVVWGGHGVIDGEGLRRLFYADAITSYFLTREAAADRRRVPDAHHRNAVRQPTAPSDSAVSGLDGPEP